MLRWLEQTFTPKPQPETAFGPIGLDVREGGFDVVYAVGDIHGSLDFPLESDRKIEADIAEG